MGEATAPAAQRTPKKIEERMIADVGVGLEVTGFSFNEMSSQVNCG